ncbi:MAG: DUF3261 domain-containing protein [Desulfuromonas sp.]|nr:DUF3261 domain-containing protein [Desulfuromonas sp.]
MKRYGADMQRWGKVFFTVLCCVLVTACSAPVPFKQYPPQPMPEMSAQQLLDNCWLTTGHRYLCRHSGLLEVFTRKVPLEGVVKVDTTENSARLVAMDSMGVKLFDISVSRDDFQLNYLLPVLEEHRQLPQMVAKSVQHIFLAPYPQAADQLEYTGNGYWLRSRETGASFNFIGAPVRLNTKVVHSAEQQWQATYYQYKDFAGSAADTPVNSGEINPLGLWAPTGIVLDDNSGFRLTLWIQEIRELQ